MDSRKSAEEIARDGRLEICKLLELINQVAGKRGGEKPPLEKDSGGVVYENINR